MKKNKQLLLGSSIGVLLLLIVAAYDENFRREWRDIQAAGRNEEGAIAVQLRQVVNPGLGAADRCVSCHVTMGPGEQSVIGAKVLATHRQVVHDPAEYGCTVCHGGQGAATEKDDAHGHVEFWPLPMLPAGMSYAGCGTCHTPLGIPTLTALHTARGVFERLDCMACHRVDGRGGTIRPDGGGMEALDLSRAGYNGYDAEWYAKHLKKSGEAAAGPWKASFSTISDEDRESLRVYLSTRVGAAPLVEAKAAFNSTGCLGCHKVSGVGGDEGPDLTRAGEKDPGQVNIHGVPGEPSLANWMGEHFRSPGSLVAGSQMPPLGLGEADVRLLTFYTLSLRRRDVPGNYTPRDRMRATRLGEREFASDAATLFGTFCAGCHGLDGLGRKAPGMAAFPSIANVDFLRVAPEQLIRETIRKGRPGRRMPAWEREGGLRAGDVDKLVGYLMARAEPGTGRGVRALRLGHPSQSPPGEGKRLFAAACSGCHGAEGQGGEGPALHNQVLLANATDDYFVETISRGRRGTAMVGFQDPSPVHRTLDAGDIESIVTFLRSWEEKKK